MRFIAEKWFVGPIAAAVAVYVVWLACEIRAQDRTRHIVKAEVGRVYELAKAGRYDDISRQYLAAPDAVAYLRQQERLFGKITAYEVTPGYWGGLENANASVSVSRERLAEGMLETADSYNRGAIGITGPPVDSTYDANGNRTLLARDDALALAKHVVHQAAQGKVSSLRLQRIGGDWLVTYHQSSDSFGVDRALVLSQDGRLEQTALVKAAYSIARE